MRSFMSFASWTLWTGAYRSVCVGGPRHVCGSRHPPTGWFYPNTWLRWQVRSLKSCSALRNRRAVRSGNPSCYHWWHAPACRTVLLSLHTEADQLSPNPPSLNQPATSQNPSLNHRGQRQEALSPVTEICVFLGVLGAMFFWEILLLRIFCSVPPLIKKEKNIGIWLMLKSVSNFTNLTLLVD